VLSPVLHWHPLLQSATTSAPRHLWIRSLSVVRSIGAQKSPLGISSSPVDQLHPGAIEQRAVVSDLTQSSQTDMAVSLVTIIGWQKLVVKSFGFSGLTGATTVELVPFLHWHPLLQSATTSASRHLWTRSVSLVRSIGAQKSPLGISSLPSDQLHPGAAAQRATVSDATQPFQIALVVSLETLTGWQKSAENNGILSSGLSVVAIVHSQVP
jgi:hypothetical protein